MKQFYFSLALLTFFSLAVFGRQKENKFGTAADANELVVAKGSQLKSTKKEPTVDDLLACPENSVLSGAWDSDAVWTGSKNAELKRPGMNSRYYQYFSDCYQTVNKIHWWGIFNYWYTEDENGNYILDEGEDKDGDGELTQEWCYCGEKAGIDPETGEASKPIDFEIKFYKVGADGMPGEVVYEKNLSSTPRFTSVVRTGEPKEYAGIYEFSAELGETIRLESGYFSVSAVAEEDAPTCWFSVIVNDAVPGFGMHEVNGEYLGQDNSMCYCLVGDGEYNAKKALKFNRLMSPVEGSNGKYEKVQVELMNIGTEDISNARLELYEGDKLLASESIGHTIESFFTYKYTFEARIDCSEEGEHTFTIKNVTEGDEKIANQELLFTIETAASGGGVCPSEGGNFSMECISSVKIGSIDNAQETTSGYSDYTNLKTSLNYGETLELHVTAEGEVYVGAWVDWNSNGSFDDEGELMGYLESPNSFLPVTIPEKAVVTEGEKVLRIMATYYLEAPCGEYTYGETEDYTLVVVRPEATPAIAVDKSMIESHRNQNAETVNLEVSNEVDDAALEGTISVQYALPLSPDTRGVTTMSTKTGKPVALRKSQGVQRRNVLPQAEGAEEAAYVLKYDRGMYDVIALSNGDMVTYAQYYPGDMLSHIAGMQVSSVEVYINDVPEKAKVVIYGEKSQTEQGALLAEKAFTPQAKQWNKIALDAPLTIGDTDLWIGVYMEGFKEDEYHIGIDEGSANVGFGDLVNIGDPYWWSLSDLGVDNNFCIRANVTGERTKAINWLSLDKTSFTVPAGSNETVAVTIDGQGLTNTLYEALISISSNDVISPKVNIPVYVSNEGYSKVETPWNSALSVYVKGEELLVNAVADLSAVSMFDMKGACLKSVKTQGQTVVIPLSDIQSGVYVLSVQYLDGSKESIKVPVLK